jgi:hypothetical protein
MKTKPTKFTPHISQKNIFAALDGDTPDLNFNVRYKYSVRVGTKWGYRSKNLNSLNRYELSDTPQYFYSEVAGRECFHFLKNKGARFESELA